MYLTICIVFALFYVTGCWDAFCIKCNHLETTYASERGTYQYGNQQQLGYMEAKKYWEGNQNKEKNIGWKLVGTCGISH